MERTEQEKRIEKGLFDLIKSSGNLLRLQFRQKDDNQAMSRDEIKSFVTVERGKVLLVLAEELEIL
jgi:hypothetical protein